MSNKKIIPHTISIPVYFFIDEKQKVTFDFEQMANYFEDELSKLDNSIVVMCSIENKND